jgi:hypothetical protein
MLMRKLLSFCITSVFLFNQVAFGEVESYSTLRPQSNPIRTANDLRVEFISSNTQKSTADIASIAPKSSSAGLSPEQLQAFQAFYDDHKGLTADEMNAKRIENLIAEGKLTTSEFSFLEDMPVDIQDTIESLIKGELNIYIYSAGEASRMMESLVKYGLVSQEDSTNPEVLRKYRRWNTDIWELVDLINSKKASLEALLKQKQTALSNLSEEDKAFKDTKADISTLTVLVNIANTQSPEYARSLTIGPRHIQALVDGIKAMAQKHGFDAKDVLSNLKLTLGVNNEILEDAAQDLKDNNFFGLNPENIVFVMNDFSPAYVLDKDGKFTLAEYSIHTNYNHGFNIINANTKYSSYAYDEKAGRFVLQEDKALDYLLNKGAKTTLIHRSNDLITMVPEQALDLDMYAAYRYLHNEYGANVLVEVLNNFTGQKGGLLLARTDQKQQGPFGFLAEGLAVKTPVVETALAQITKEYQAQGLPGIPYNRLYQYFDIADAKSNLDSNNNLMPMSIKDEAKTPDGKKTKGYYSPEIPTGDQTILDGSKTAAVMRRNDFLLDNGILPEDIHYTKGQGTLIHDFKELKNLPDAIAVVDHQDRGALKTVSAGVALIGLPDSGKSSTAKILQIKTFLDGAALSEHDQKNIAFAAAVANLSDATGTIVYNDTVLSSKQQQILQGLIGIGTQGLAELETKLGCKVKLLSQGGIVDNARTIIISSEKLSGFNNVKYFITEQTQIDTSYVAVVPFIAIAKGLLCLENKAAQPKLYTALMASIRSLSKGLLSERDIEEAITAYINGNPMFIKLPPAVSYDYDQLEQLQRQALMVLISA